jgi:hypothetical protein
MTIWSNKERDRVAWVHCRYRLNTGSGANNRNPRTDLPEKILRKSCELRFADQGRTHLPGAGQDSRTMKGCPQGG